MKYIKLFEDSQNKYDDFKDDVEKIFEDDNWLVIKPKSFYALCYYDNQVRYNGNNFNYKNSQIYININKNDDDNIVILNFDRDDFYDENSTVYLKDFFEENSELYNLYGDIVQCDEIIEENGEYWLVVDGYSDFVDFFDTGNSKNDLSENFVKGVLVGEGFEFFQYDDIFDIDDYGIETDEDNFLQLKVVLILEKMLNEEKYDYDLDDIKDYDDICSIVKEYGLKKLKNVLKYCVRKAHEQADADKAYDELTDAIYKFFNLELENGSPKWQRYKGSKDQKLWIRFNSKSDSGRAKFIFHNYDDSFEDDNKIDYSSPYNGYYGDSKVVNDYFNEEVPEKLCDYNSNGIDDDMIHQNVEMWKQLKKDNPIITDKELYDELEIFMNTKKYNL